MMDSPYTQLRHALSTAYPAAEATALARWVMEERYGLTQTQLLMGKDTDLSATDREELEKITQRLLKKEPVQYVLGHTTFCGHTFNVGPGVLIPRPETAQLVQLITEQCRTPRRILDMGTGSGCIAISLALAYPQAEVHAWDISEEALRIANANAQRLDARVTLHHQDMLAPEESGEQWDIIVSNPPYIRQCEAAEMEENVLCHEPHLALFVPDDDPLRFYRAILDYAAQHLAAQGHVYMETNRVYAHEIAELAGKYGLVDAVVYQDSYGQDRMVRATKGGVR